VLTDSSKYNTHCRIGTDKMGAETRNVAYVACVAFCGLKRKLLGLLHGRSVPPT